jgi:hypothetical protein
VSLALKGGGGKRDGWPPRHHRSPVGVDAGGIERADRPEECLSFGHALSE